MVEIKSLQVQDTSFIAIQMRLPGYPLYFIISTKTILSTDRLAIDHFQKENHVAVILVQYHYGFEAMLRSHVVAYNEVAKRCGVTAHMSGEEALILSEGKKEA